MHSHGSESGLLALVESPHFMRPSLHRWTDAWQPSSGRGTKPIAVCVAYLTRWCPTIWSEHPKDKRLDTGTGTLRQMALRFSPPTAGVALGSATARLVGSKARDGIVGGSPSQGDGATDETLGNLAFRSSNSNYHNSWQLKMIFAKEALPFL